MLAVGAFTENFRSALNGFNRTDVVQFIQRQTVEHEKAMRLLCEENARLKQASTEVSDSTEQLQAENKQLSEKLSLQDSQLAALVQQNASLMQQVQSLLGEKASLEAALVAARKAAPAPEKTLDRPMATPAGIASPPSSFDEMELAAYRRAELAERTARDRAAASSERMQSIFRQADEKITLTAADMNQLLDSFRSSYEQIQAIMENARNILAESAESLKASAELSGVV